jgi:hypothetical protein
VRKRNDTTPRTCGLHIQGGQDARHSRCLSSGHSHTCCGVVSSVRPRQQRPLSAPAERAILNAPPRFAAPLMYSPNR